MSLAADSLNKLNEAAAVFQSAVTECTTYAHMRIFNEGSLKELIKLAQDMEEEMRSFREVIHYLKECQNEART